MVEIDWKTESRLALQRGLAKESMYTQCPDCDIAFKVTAEVLKQAAGKVRCGGCGNAFNALAYLSEQMPHQSRDQEANAPTPELTPEIIDTDDGLPHSISAAQSAALLKTLDELAGSDIRIEDTGVEWRVLDDDAAATDDDEVGLELENVDEFLDDNPTPIDQFLTATPDVVDAPEIFSDADDPHTKTSVDELRFDDNTPLPDDFDLDDESSYAAQDAVDAADAASQEIIEEPFAAEQAEQEPQPDIELSEPEEWTDILDEFSELVEDIAADDEADEIGLATSGEIPLDVDSQFALQAEAMGIDLSGINDLEESSDDEVEDDDNEVSADISQLDLIDEIDDDVESLIEEPVIEQHSIEDELAALEVSDAVDRALDDFDVDDDEPGVNLEGSDDAENGQYIAPLSEAEQTVNMQIDHDLMALAIEDEDGFASTIIIAEKDAEASLSQLENDIDDKDVATDDDDNEDRQAASRHDLGDESLFETIIMEGEFVRSAPASEDPAKDAAIAAEIASFKQQNDAEPATTTDSKRWGVIAAAVALVLLFAIQIVHQSREALATIPAFSNTVGQVYRAFGQPLQPAWDVTGWRIEASDDVIEVAQGEENLTVYSRVGNNSDQAMPYPLINISLTDRFLEPVGSQILDPADYLPTDLDPRKLVDPGNTFNAIINIRSPSAEASGYKVDVCYRQTDGRLRCAIDDFK